MHTFICVYYSFEINKYLTQKLIKPEPITFFLIKISVTFSTWEIKIRSSGLYWTPGYYAIDDLKFVYYFQKFYWEVFVQKPQLFITLCASFKCFGRTRKVPFCETNVYHIRWHLRARACDYFIPANIIVWLNRSGNTIFIMWCIIVGIRYGKTMKLHTEYSYMGNMPFLSLKHFIKHFE